MFLTRLIAAGAVVALASTPIAASTQSAGGPADLVRASVERIPIGSRVQITLHDGARVKGVLMLVDNDVVVVRERKRRPEPPLRIPLATVADVELEQNGGGIGRAVAMGAAVGAGAALAVIGVLAAMFSD